jgi:hypothetical protein
LGDEMMTGLSATWFRSGGVFCIYIRPGIEVSVPSLQYLFKLSRFLIISFFCPVGVPELSSSAMSRFAPFLVSALAVAAPLVHCIAVPGTPLEHVSDKALKVREPIAFAAPVQIGDLLSFHDGRLLRRDNETATFNVFARESFPDPEALEKRAVVVKRADPKWDPPLDKIPKDEYEDEMIVDCVEMGKAKLGERLGGGSFGDVYKAIDEKNKFIAVKLVNTEAERDHEYDITKKVDDNDHIVNVLAKCKKFGTKYPIAMELVEGESLQKRIDSKVYSSMCAHRFDS